MKIIRNLALHFQDFLLSEKDLIKNNLKTILEKWKNFSWLQLAQK